MECGVVGRNGTAVFWSDDALYRYADAGIEYIGPGGFNAYDYDGRGIISTRGPAIGPAIYVSDDRGMRTIAEYGHPAPGGGTFQIVPWTRVSIDHGHVAFTSGGFEPPTTVLYSDVGGALQRVVGVGDTLLGQTVSSVSIGPDALSGNQIVFIAGFTNGNAGIFIATVPEPAALPLSIISWLAAISRSRQRWRR
jgi:hypothetical protein